MRLGVVMYLPHRVKHREGVSYRPHVLVSKPVLAIGIRTHVVNVHSPTEPAGETVGDPEEGGYPPPCRPDYEMGQLISCFVASQQLTILVCFVNH